MEDYKYGGMNITGLRIVDLGKAEAVALEGYGQRSYGSQTRLNQSSFKVMPGCRRHRHLTGFFAVFFFIRQTETALTYDAVQLFAKALHELDRSQDVTFKSLNCEGTDTWVHGNSLVNYMKLVIDSTTSFSVNWKMLQVKNKQ